MNCFKKKITISNIKIQERSWREIEEDIKELVTHLAFLCPIINTNKNEYPTIHNRVLDIAIKERIEKLNQFQEELMV